ncbi:VOC family protein [Kaistia dalseonensis]|uniref:3-demethylubiquinone-9 3-methyltransferase (Glyoxalase superfamily) n=1 Tax=Kaistia dalseonensis TaxID=410840 RepID=A0ABU0H8F6_9HYPH|nr:VOC family protein [Kaistia dalseonensis]MCX5495686.1 VOC family protein [Kaistia dalseonensis]MDQ0438282.1 putative 3-demethylubiquinone-9 3-methyltransferase (glyoxalase superfamily) [Kaistia dalseonensis]
MPSIKSKISPCLWFATEAEEAASFYVSLLPGSHIDHVQKNVGDTPAGKDGTVLVVDFTLGGQTFLALNAGTRIAFNQAISFSIDCADQAEVDQVWDRILAGGGSEVQCGWITDRFGVSWQVVPSALPRLLGDPDKVKAERVMKAMMEMIKLDVAGLQAAYDGEVVA